MSETPQGPESKRDQPTQTHDFGFAAGGYIGPYRVLGGASGKAGWAEVWRAEAFSPVRRQVALKLLGRHGHRS